MPTTIRAAVSRTVGEPLSIEALSLADPGPDEVRVAVTACAVCHSDLSFVDGIWASPGPTVWGHEAAGVVTDVGQSSHDARSSTAVAPGDSVVVSLVRTCGACRACRAGNEVGCSGEFALDRAGPLTDGDGHPVGQGLRTAAFAEAVVVHRSQVIPVADRLAPTKAALLGCGVLTGVGAVRHTAGVAAGDAVVVIGTGGVGLSAVQGAALVGAESIVAVDPSPERRSVARAVGATHDLDPSGRSSDELAADLQALLGHGADHVLVATGAPAALNGALDLLAPGAALTIVGMPPDGTRLTIDPVALAASGQRILGSKMGSARPGHDIPWLVDQASSGGLDLDAMIGRSFRLDDIDGAFDALRAGDGVRPLVTFDR